MLLGMTTGLDLRLARTARRVKATALAARMGVHKSTVSRIEADEAPSADNRRRYLEALDALAEPRGAEVA